MEIKIKEWKLREDADKTVIEGTYAVMMGTKVVAESSFNTPMHHCGTDIAFPRELLDEVKAVSLKVQEAIKTSF